MLLWWLGRSLGAIIIFGCIFWLGFEWGEDDPDLVGLFSILIGTALAWIFAEATKPQEVASNSPDALHDHDIALGNRFRNHFSNARKQKLRDTSFGSRFRHDEWDFLWSLENWRGIEFEFEDPALDNLAAGLMQVASELIEAIYEYAEPVEGREYLWSVAPAHEGDYHSVETSTKVSELNKLADRVATAADEFELAFRKRAPKKAPTVSTFPPQVVK